MKTNSLLKKMSLCMSIGMMTLDVSAQTIITIDNNSGSTTAYQTIQAAHDAATAGSIIYVQPSATSYGPLTIDKALTIVGRSHSIPSKVSSFDYVYIRSSNVTLKGVQFSFLSSQSGGAPTPPPFVGLTILDCEVSSIQLGEGNAAPIVVMDNVTIRGSVINNAYVYADATNVLLSNNIFTSATPLFIYNSSSLVVANNFFASYYGLTFYNYSITSPVIFYNNMFITNYGSDALIDFAVGAFNLSNNLTYNYDATGNVQFTSSSGGSYTQSNTLANTNPQFTNVDPIVPYSLTGLYGYTPGTRLQDDLTLQAGSPALTGGGGGSQIGVNNNNFKYDLLGSPHGIPTLDVITYDGAVPKNGNINVTIQAKAH